MNTAASAHFDRQYELHLKHLKLKGLQPKTIEAYARAIRRLGGYFSHRIDELTEAQLTAYFSDLIGTHSWSAVKLDLYGLKFYTTHVLKKPWVMPNLIKPPKAQRLPDIVTVEEAKRLFAATRVVSYRVFYFTLYSLGLRLAVRTVSGATFLWLVLQHVLPKGFRRARNFGFLHSNSKGLIALLQVVLKVLPNADLSWMKPRPPFLCACCGAPMQVVRRRIPWHSTDGAAQV